MISKAKETRVEFMTEGKDVYFRVLLQVCEVVVCTFGEIKYPNLEAGGHENIFS